MADANQAERVEVHLTWPLLDDLQPLYANQFGIFSVGPEHVLMFGQFLPLALISGRDTEEVSTYLKNASINPLAKIVITPEGLKAFHSMLSGYVERLKATEGKDHD